MTSLQTIVCLTSLLQAWVSGARSWTDAQRESFANDLTRPQLVAVTDNLNQSKGSWRSYLPFRSTC